ncbi:MAG: hypothetical protein LBG57_05730 [Treponema sp.]|jgi:ABC-type sulfate transport system permease component|nr:hypothetical protein [Treponema sp.]
MIQLYFLSILCNSLTAYILILDNTGEAESIEGSLKFSFRSGVFRLVLGILCALTGVLKLLSPSQDSVPVLGDLVPALAGLLAGFTLIFSYYRDHASIGAFSSEGKFDRIGDAFLKYKKGLGFILLASAALHFLFPGALFL